MALTPEQRIERRKYIGSSDLAAIMGLDPYRDASDVWLDKTGQLEDRDDGDEHTRRGTLLEPAILNWAEEKIGKTFVRDVMSVADDGIRAVNFDGLGDTFTVEAKSTVNLDEWGEDGTDQVPDRVVVQCHQALDIAGPNRVMSYVPMLCPGYKSFDFRMYEIQRDDELCKRLADAARHFMERHVRRMIQPDGFRPSLEVLKRLRRVAGKVIELSQLQEDTIISWKTAKAKAKESAEYAELMKRDVIAMLGDAEGATFSSGMLTYLPVTVRAHQRRESTSRRLTIKGEKND